MKNDPVTLKQIAEVTGGKLSGDAGAVVTDVSHDSRRAGPGCLFVAVRGELFDAHKFVPQVIEQGAVGVISELDRSGELQPEKSGVPGSFPWLKVENVRRAMALAAAEVHHHPSRELQLVGITGTNGKTTTAYLLASIPEAAGELVAMTGTVEYRLGAQRFKADRTTPEATDMQRLLREAVDIGCKTAVMECSSQAMDFHRCDALDYAVAVFSNLTRDHLDYHKTMENYWYAKQRLFDGRLGTKPRVSVINADDPYGVELAERLEQEGARVVRYGVTSEADVTAHNPEFSLEGMHFNLRTPAGEREFHSPLVGPPHIYNTLAAVASGLALGYELDVIARALEKCTGAPGRFEHVKFDDLALSKTILSTPEYRVVVDYAHSDDALLNVLKSARAVTKGRIITVFGCGGDRDPSKRAPMGEAAGSLSDVVVVTSDNPRSEIPGKIMADVEVGLLSTRTPYIKIAERREAIRFAISEARANDLILIAGKGHEDYQIIGREVFHFNDREVAREEVVAFASSLTGSLQRQKAFFQEAEESRRGSADFFRPLRIFLCHAHDDKPAVRALHKRLLAEDFLPWFDEESLLAGSNWRFEIEKALREADVVVVCLSHTSINKKGFVQKEIKFALDAADEYPEGTIYLIPLKLEECEVPPQLARWQWVNLFGERGYEQLLKSLRARSGSIAPK